MTEITDQPPPIGNGRLSIQSLVRSDLEQREQLGIERYGTALQPGNGRNAIVDAYQEAMDLTCYLRQVIEEGGAVGRHGAEPLSDEPTELTAGQILTMILDGDESRRLELCGKALGNAREAHQCWCEDHRGRIADLEKQVNRLARALVRVMNGWPLSPDSDV